MWYNYPMMIRVMLSILACKLCRRALRLLGRGGTDFPGRVALKLCPNVLGVLAKNVTTVLVTGTNGKTTTSRMIEQVLADAGISYFANKSGANLLSGVTAEFAAHSTLTGKCKYDYALIEADEAAFKAISRFVGRSGGGRDQRVPGPAGPLRRGQPHPGQHPHRHQPQQACRPLPQRPTIPSPAPWARAWTTRSSTTAWTPPIYKTRVAELSDAPYCLHCKHAYVYDYVTYGHLGGYRCPNCGYRRPTPQVSVAKVLVSDAQCSKVEFALDGKTVPATINLPGGYNIYNAATAMAVAQALELDAKGAAQSLGSFSCGFGRMERFDIRGASLRMILIKNPAGCNQVLNFLTDTAEPFVFVACLNDRAQDGKDVSWIWDVDFERLVAMEQLEKIVVSGVRADDMAMRFKYAGMPTDKIQVIRDYSQLVKSLIQEDKPVYIMPTYTAMLGLRGVISKEYGFKAFWE